MARARVARKVPTGLFPHSESIATARFTANPASGFTGAGCGELRGASVVWYNEAPVTRGFLVGGGMPAVQLTIRPDSVAVVTLDQPGRKANVLNVELWSEFVAILDSLAPRTDLKGLV